MLATHFPQKVCGLSQKCLGLSQSAHSLFLRHDSWIVSHNSHFICCLSEPSSQVPGGSRVNGLTLLDRRILQALVDVEK